MAASDLHDFRQALSEASRAFKAAAVEEMRVLGVHAGQNFLLEALREKEPLTVGQVAQQLRIEVPTAVRMVQRMQASGLVQRRADPDDRRRAMIYLTSAGRKAAEAVPGVLDGVTRRALHGLDRGERQALIDLLSQVTANLDWPPSAPR